MMPPALLPVAEDGTFKAYAEEYFYTVSGAGVEYATGSVTMKEEDPNEFIITLQATAAGAWDGKTQTEPQTDENGVYRIVDQDKWYVAVINQTTTWNPVVGQDTWYLQIEGFEDLRYTASVVSVQKTNDLQMAIFEIDQPIGPLIYQRTGNAMLSISLNSLAVTENALDKQNGQVGVWLADVPGGRARGGQRKRTDSAAGGRRTAARLKAADQIRSEDNVRASREKYRALAGAHRQCVRAVGEGGNLRRNQNRGCGYNQPRVCRGHSDNRRKPRSGIE